jgi:hypothetical protein
MTNKKASGVQTSPKRQRAWEPMTLVRVGHVSDVMHATTGANNDGMGPHTKP